MVNIVRSLPLGVTLELRQPAFINAMRQIWAIVLGENYCLLRHLVLPNRGRVAETDVAIREGPVLREPLKSDKGLVPKPSNVRCPSTNGAQRAERHGFQGSKAGRDETGGIDGEACEFTVS